MLRLRRPIRCAAARISGNSIVRGRPRPREARAMAKDSHFSNTVPHTFEKKPSFLSMNTLKRLTLGIILFNLSACAAPTAVGYAPNTSEAERDQLHKTTPPPNPEPMEELTATTVTTSFDAPHAFMTTWFKELALEDVFLGTEEIPGVSGTDPLRGDSWDVAGARRRVLLKDGGTALEQILEAELPNRVRYVVWNYTSDAAKYVRYGVGEFRFKKAGARTEVSWTYAFEPRGWPASWFLPGFVNGDYRAMMIQALARMKTLAEQRWQHSAKATGDRRDTALATLAR